MITLINRQRKIPIDEQWLTAAVQDILKQLDYETFDIGILLTTNKTIKRYNETYRHKKGPTDILSFSYYDLKPGERIVPETDDEKNLGDLILSPEYIVTSAQKLGVSFDHRLLILVIHGICHLLGYDHETDKEYHQMKELEAKIFAQLPKKLTR